MRTTKPISTISYNTPRYLVCKLTELCNAHVIAFWAFIQHQPEDDEGGDKMHCHVYVEPARMLQTEDLRAELKELDPNNPKRPLGCMPWRSSKWDDWCMYGLHDRAYLAAKGETRRYEYRLDQFATSDEDTLLCMYRQINIDKLTPWAAMAQAIEQGLTFAEYIRHGRVPIQQLRQYQLAWELLMAPVTNRNGHPGHKNDYPD